MSLMTRIMGFERGSEGWNFVECAVCRAKPGSPTLCDGCLYNRATINALKQRILDGKFSGRDATWTDLFPMVEADRSYLFSSYYLSKWMPEFCHGYGHWSFG